MAIAAFEKFTLELVYHQSSLAGIQIVTTNDSLFSHLYYHFDRNRKLLIDIRFRLAHLKKDRAIVSTHVTSPSSFVGYVVGGGNAPTFTDAAVGVPLYTARRHAVRREENVPARNFNVGSPFLRCIFRL